MNRLRQGVLIFSLVVFAVGCAHHKKPLLPAHDEVLVYNLPYDLTFLRAIDGLQSVPGWDLEMTSKDAGLIRVRNINFSSFNDSDQRLVTFLIKRVENRKTSVELDKDSQQVFGAGDLIKAVGGELAREEQK